MISYDIRIFVATVAAALAVIGCGDPTTIYVESDAGPCDASYPGDAAPLIIACSAGRSVDQPCLTVDGTSLRDGECCTDGQGNLGLCIAVDNDGGDLVIPYCNTQL